MKRCLFILIFLSFSNISSGEIFDGFNRQVIYPDTMIEVDDLRRILKSRNSIEPIMKKIVPLDNDSSIAISIYGAVFKMENKIWVDISPKIEGRIIKDIFYNGESIIAIGEHSGMLSSFDQGSTWKLIDYVNPFGYINSVHGSDKKLIAVGDYGEIFESLNNGEQWHKVRNNYREHLKYIYSNEKNFVCLSEAGEIILSKDNGSQWFVLESLGFSFKSMAGYNEVIVAVGSTGTLYSSLDSGNSWNSIEIPGVFLIDFESVYQKNGKFLVVGEEGSILTFSKKDGWLKVNSNTNDDLYNIFTNGEYEFIEGYDGDRIYSDDGWDNWYKYDGTFEAISSSYVDEKIIIQLGSQGTILRSNDLGSTWKFVTFDDKPSQLYDLIKVKDNLIAIGDYGRLLISKNKGINWDTVYIEANSVISKIVYNGSELVAIKNEFINGVFKTSLVKSLDDGYNWEESKIVNSSLMALYGNSSRWVAGGNQGLILWSDRDDRWKRANVNINFNTIAIDGNEEILVAVGSIGFDGVILRSRDGGVNWEEVYSIKNNMFQNVAKTNSGFIAINSSGIFRSNSYGKDWYKMEVDFPLSTNSYQPTKIVNRDNLILVAGYSSEVIYSSDDGKTWSTVISDGYYSSGSNTSQTSEEKNTIVLPAINGGVHIISPVGKRVPRVSKIESKLNIDESLTMTFSILDPDSACDKNCILELFVAKAGGSQKDIKKLKQHPLKTERTGSFLDFSIKFNPKKELNINTGSKLLIRTNLSGKGFSITQPISNEDVTIEYDRVNYILIVSLVISIFYFMTIFVLFIFKPMTFVNVHALINKLERDSDLPSVLKYILKVSHLLLFSILLRRKRVLLAWSNNNANYFSIHYEHETKRQIFNYKSFKVYANEMVLQDENEICSYIRKVSDKLKGVISIVSPNPSDSTAFVTTLSNLAMNGEILDNKVLVVWIDKEIENLSKELIEKVRSICQDDKLPEFFIKKLLEKKLIIVVVDNLSTKSEETELAIKNLPDYVSLMFVTSQQEINFKNKLICKVNIERITKV